MKNPNGWMELRSGNRFFWAEDPETIANQLTIDDSLWSLSRMCRYNGQSKRWYTVLEHEIHMTRKARAEGFDLRTQRAFAFHDAPEAMVQDLASPFKKDIGGNYSFYEDNILKAFAIRFDFDYPLPPIIKEWDARIVKDERQQVMGKTPHHWFIDDLEPLGIKCRCWSPWRARQEFRRELALLKVG